MFPLLYFVAYAIPPQAQCSELLQDEYVRTLLPSKDMQECDIICGDLQKLEASMSSYEKDLHALRSEVSGKASAGSGSGTKQSKAGIKPKMISLKEDMTMTSLHTMFPPGSRLFKDTYNNRYQLHYKGLIASRSWPLHGGVGAIRQLLKVAWAAAGKFGIECPYTDLFGEA